MKRLFFSFMWQWRSSSGIGFNPIAILFEYEKFEPSMSLAFVVLGVGLEVTWLVPWKTKQSEYAKACIEKLGEFFSIETDEEVVDAIINAKEPHITANERSV